MAMDEYSRFEDLLGQTLTAVEVVRADGKTIWDDRIDLTTVEGVTFRLFHSQDCCEGVYIEDIIGNTDDLVGNPLLMAEGVSNANEPPKDDYMPDSYTWTFYKLATIKGYVTIRWYGTSNGYYSESVNFERLL
jgi:hypothetical protein